jgi:tRNA-binding protein
MAAVEEFQRLDLRIGRILEVAEFPKARKPSYRLAIDFGRLGIRASIAALKTDYGTDQLVGRQVVCVFNLPPRRIAGFDSQVLVLAATEADGTLRLLRPDTEAALGAPVT